MPEQRSEEKRQRTTDRQASAVKRHEWAIRTTERQGAPATESRSVSDPKNALSTAVPGSSVRGALRRADDSIKRQLGRSETDAASDAGRWIASTRREYERMYVKQMMRDENAVHNAYLDWIAWRKDMVTFFGAVLLGAAVLFVFAASGWIPSSMYLIGGVFVMLWGCLVMLGRTAIRDRRRRHDIRAIMEMNRQSKQA